MNIATTPKSICIAFVVDSIKQLTRSCFSVAHIRIDKHTHPELLDETESAEAAEAAICEHGRMF